MLDELSRIESIYGSVAEYNRVKYEEAESDYEPFDREIADREVDHCVYSEKIRILEGEPSDIAVKLGSEWDSKKPDLQGDWSMTHVYAWRDYGRNKLFDIMDKLCRYYCVDRNDSMSLYRTDPGTFAIGCEYGEDSNIKELVVSGLNYDDFKDIFRDLYSLGCNPSVNYCNEAGINHVISNTSLGSLRMNDFRYCGLESDESLKADLDAAGFDENVFREKTKREVYSDYDISLDDGLDKLRLNKHDNVRADSVDDDFSDDFDVEGCFYG